MLVLARQLIGKAAVAAVSVFCLFGPANAADFSNKAVNIIRGPDGRPCTFFILDGVSPADPTTPNTSWMALRQASSGYKENLAILMSAKLTGRVVNVSTTGAVVPECGHVEAYVVMLP